MSTIEEITKLRVEHYGIIKAAAPKRNARVASVVATVRAAYVKTEGKFRYQIGKREVCENAYFRALGKHIT